MSADLLIKNAKIVTPTDTYEGCVYVEGGGSPPSRIKQNPARRAKSTPQAAISCRAWWTSTCT